MAAMTSRFNIRCVIQYYSDQWFRHRLNLGISACLFIKKRQIRKFLLMQKRSIELVLGFATWFGLRSHCSQVKFASLLGKPRCER